MFFSGSNSQENTIVEKSVSMNTTVNGSSFWSCSSLINPEALKIGLTVAYSFILVVSLVGNFLIVLIVYKTPTLRKPINMLIANMAISDLLFPIILFPVRLARFSAPDSSIWFSCSFVLYVIVTRYISYTNCAINPIICLIFSSNYRQALKRLINCCDKVQD